ncbi:serine/threonine-protein kinase [Streptomyces hoynatensis]|uniref:Serine/threonine protein kinase n=1 Tax=Streptomyces hoynatensis TaxID=1141874 RepID=A0A3A9YWL3_9ACTN|nr:serine/threonine-protein kinase [Streptomyces hoynatensis]RKN40365.1 serine/threonine protein kinase [Streptomyces hoynatensis]
MVIPLEAGDPTVIGGYRISGRLGQGGMGRVYLSHTPGGRPVAIKLVRAELADDADFRRRFQREVRAAQQVQGLYTAPVIDSDTEGPQPWVATVYVAGPSLHAAVTEHGALPVPAAALTLAGIAEALQAIHGAGIVHRDLKPSNVLLAADGPRVIDFGIARAADATALTHSGVTVGTPAFMAPEQALGRPATPAADVFALGHIAVFAATGEPAFGEAATPAVLYRIVHEEPELSGVPEGLREIAARCLAKDPAERPTPAEVIELCRPLTQDAEPQSGTWLPPAVIDDIDRYAATATSVAPPPAHTTPPAPYPATPPAALPTAGLPPTPQPFAPQPPGAPPYPGPAATTPAGAPAGTPAGIAAGAPAGTPTAATPPPAARPRRGRLALIVACGVLVGLLGGLLGASLLNGDDKDENAGGTADAGGSTETTQDGQIGEGEDESASGESAPPPDASEETEEPPADPTPVDYEGIDIPENRTLRLSDDPPTPVTTESGVLYEGDFGFNSDLFDGYQLATSGDSTLVLLRPDEEGTLDTCRSVTRYTSVIDQESAPAGSRICLRTQAGDVALVTVTGYAPEDSPSYYLSIDLRIWRGAAFSG